jgi:hypothetical protein
MWPTTERTLCQDARTTAAPEDVAPHGATLDVEYAGAEATLRLVPDPDDVDAGVRLMCAAVSHVRRRHTRRVHTAIDLTAPSGGALLEALWSREGIDVAGIAMRRAGSTALVTIDLLPVAANPLARPETGLRHRGEPPRGRRPARPRPRSAHATAR